MSWFTLNKHLDKRHIENRAVNVDTKIMTSFRVLTLSVCVREGGGKEVGAGGAGRGSGLRA